MMKTFLIVGLGNPGSRYDATRHNLGIRTVRAWMTELQAAGHIARPWTADKECRAQTVAARVDDLRLIGVFPLTFMNDSGQAVACLARRHRLPSESIVIVHDELELPFGNVSWKERGSAQGHNGVRSVQVELNNADIPRLRLGIGRPSENILVETYVLQPFQPTETSGVETMVQQATDMLNQRLVSSPIS